MTVVRDDFRGPTLDRARWFPHYLPAWSSREATKADFDFTGQGLRLFIPLEAGRWCDATHPAPLRVSGIQSGNRSGPVGSHLGQQRFRDDLVVTEAQPTFVGWLPVAGRVSIRCRMELSSRSMAAMWMSGFEEHPDDAGELCAFEVFGRSVRSGATVEVGVGVKAKFDPRLVDDFVAPRLDLDVSELHTYSVEWGDTGSTFCVDDNRVHQSSQAPRYPMQIMIAVFDFPAWSDGTHDLYVPELTIDWIEGDASSSSR